MVANLEEEAKEMKIQIERLELSTNPEVKNIFEKKRIELNLQSKSDLQTLVSLSNVKLPDMTKIFINFVDKDIKSFNKFMNDAFPNRLKILSLNRKT